MQGKIRIVMLPENQKRTAFIPKSLTPAACILHCALRDGGSLSLRFVAIQVFTAVRGVQRECDVSFMQEPEIYLPFEIADVYVQICGVASERIETDSSDVMVKGKALLLPLRIW